MANPTSRSTLQEFCLRRLGKGVIDINVSTDQIDDRTDEALQFFQGLMPAAKPAASPAVCCG